VQLALQEGLDVTGTLGVLILAKHRGLISLRESLRALEQTNFRRSATLFAQVLGKHESK
jgi:predicted nucleic acid-binding protein